MFADERRLIRNSTFWHRFQAPLLMNFSKSNELCSWSETIGRSWAKRVWKEHAVNRAGLNEREAPGKVVSTSPPKRLTQLRSVSHVLASTLPKHRSKTSKPIRFGSVHFRDNWGWPCTAVGMPIICSTRKMCHKNRFLPRWHYHLYCHRLSDHLRCTNRPFTYVLRKDRSTLSRRSKRTPFRKNVQRNITQKQLEPYYLTEVLRWEVYNIYTY